MSALIPSRDAERRIRQRGMRLSDPGFILRYGCKIGGDIHDIYFLKRKNAQREIGRLQGEIRSLRHNQGPSSGLNRASEIRRRKREIHRLERLRGWKVVVADGIVVTCYRSSQRDRKRMFQRGKERA